MTRRFLLLWGVLLIVEPASAGTFLPSEVRPTTFSTALSEARAARGRAVVIHLYASWCPPCRVEFPQLVKVVADYDGRPVKWLMLSLDHTAEDLTRYLRKVGPLHFEPLLIGKGSGDPTSALRDLGLKFENGVPYTAILDPTGQVVAQWTGPRSSDAYRAAVDRALQKLPPGYRPPTPPLEPQSLPPKPPVEVVKDDPKPPAEKPAESAKTVDTRALPPREEWEAAEQSESPMLPVAVGAGMAVLVLILGLLFLRK